MQENTISDMKSNVIGESLFFGLLGKIIYTDFDKAWLE